MSIYWVAMVTQKSLIFTLQFKFKVNYLFKMPSGLWQARHLKQIKKSIFEVPLHFLK